MPGNTRIKDDLSLGKRICVSCRAEATRDIPVNRVERLFCTYRLNLGKKGPLVHRKPAFLEVRDAEYGVTRIDEPRILWTSGT